MPTEFITEIYGYTYW